jgi:hypothetical protein
MTDAQRELLIAAKEAAVMLALVSEASGVSPRGPGFDRLMAAIKAAQAEQLNTLGEKAG